MKLFKNIKTKEDLQQEVEEQKIIARDRLIVAEIRKIYSQDDEFKMARISAVNPQDERFLQYNAKVEEIIKQIK